MNTAGHPEATAHRGLELTPFRGLRYDPDRVGSLAAVTSPPYDVVVRPDGLHHLESADPYNIVRLILPQAATPAARNEQAAGTLRRWLAEGVLAADPEPGLYVYEQQDGDGMLQRGIIGALRLSDPVEGVVLPHEDVMPHVVADRAALMRATSANLEPLLLTYRGDGTPTGTAAVVERTAERPPLLSTTTEDGYSHRLWSVTDPADLARVQSDLAHHQALIADGHHRWATYRRLRAEHPSPSPWDHGLVLLVDTARYPLRVRAIHRLLHGVPVATPSPPSTATSAYAASKSRWPRPWRPSPTRPARATPSSSPATAPSTWSTAPTRTFCPARSPPTAPAPGAPWTPRSCTPPSSPTSGTIPEDDPAHIAYIHDTAATVEKAERDGGTAVLMHPVREEVVRDLARQGVTMPRKSTSFGPKPASGLVLRAHWTYDAKKGRDPPGIPPLLLSLPHSAP